MFNLLRDIGIKTVLTSVTLLPCFQTSELFLRRCHCSDFHFTAWPISLLDISRRDFSFLVNRFTLMVKTLRNGANMAWNFHFTTWNSKSTHHDREKKSQFGVKSISPQFVWRVTFVHANLCMHILASIFQGDGNPFPVTSLLVLNSVTDLSHHTLLLPLLHRY